MITANLYSHLLIEILPKLNPSRWLIFSGILTSQKTAFLRALQWTDVEITSIKQRGKWIAVLPALCERRNLQTAKFCGSHRPPLQ